MLLTLQQQIYENKVKRQFNITDVGKEVVLLAEENGELCDASLEKNLDGIVDALGDIMAYGLGLCAMFQWSSDKITPAQAQYKEAPTDIEGLLPYIGRSVGLIAKTYKKSNKKPVSEIDRRDEFQKHIGDLISYCRDGLHMMQVEENAVLEGIISNNRIRTHQGKI